MSAHPLDAARAGRVFIAYHGGDAALAKQLAEAIRAAGGAPWLDQDDLDYGDVIGEGVVAGLHGAELVAVLVSARWRDGKGWYAGEEVDRAIDRWRREGRGRVVPVLYDGASPDAMPYGLYRLKALPVAPGGWAAAARELVRVAGGAARPIDERPPGDVPAEHRDALAAWLEDIADRFDDVDGLTPETGGKCLSTLYVRLDQRPIEGGAREALLGRELGGLGRPLDDLLRAHPQGRWTLQGDPGAGKTTQLRHLAMQRAREARDELAEGRLGAARIPIFASLAALDLRLDEQKDADAVTVAVAEHRQRALTRHDAAALDAALRWAIGAGRALVLLDGFDEVRPESVQRVRRHIALIERRSQAASLVVTSRRFGYVTPNDQFSELEILPLGPMQQRELLKRWGLTDTRIDGLMAQVAGRPAMQDMAGNPFVLTLMALLAGESAAPLPTRRVALYRAVLGRLGRPRRADEEARTGLSPEALRAALGELALALLKDHAGPWTAEELDHHLAGLPATAPLFDRLEDIPLALEADTGLLVALERRFERKRIGWRFLHRSLMECLAAEALHRRGEVAARKFAVRLAGNGPWYARWTWTRVEQIGRWAEVYCHLAAMMDAPQQFLDGIAAVHPRLAMRAMMSLDAVPVADLLGDEVDLRAVDLKLVRLLIEAVPDRQVLARALVRLARANVRNQEGLQLIAAGLVAIGAEVLLPTVAEVAGGWDAIGVPRRAWVDIPAGHFVMGSPPEEAGHLGDEGPQRRISLSAFQMATTPVTQALYAVVIGHNPSHFTGDWRRPVEQVSWEYAAAFCAALAALQGQPVRLPTEAEWEYACRAGTTARFWSGDADGDLDRVGWYDRNSGGRTHPVGRKPANPWGLCDMHGNVFEWCRDWFGRYPARPEADPPGPPHGTNRVMRGGAYDVLARWARSAARYLGHPGVRNRRVGFRLVRAPRAP